MVLKEKTKNEKPKYGWYVGKIIAYLAVIGGAGLALLIGGFFNSYPLNLIFWVIGCTISILFLWPALGLTAMNLWIPRRIPQYDFMREFKAPQVLDCGCGTGRHAIQIAKQLPQGGFLEGIDIYDERAISGSSLERVKRNATLEGVANLTNFQKGSITDIPFEDQRFNIVSILSVLHEIHDNADKEKVYREIRRVLKDDGLLFMGEWNRNSLNLILFTGIFAFVFKPKIFWEMQIKDHGFEIIKKQDVSGFIDFFAKKNLKTRLD